MVSTNDGVEKAQKHNVMFVETSAKTKAGIHNLFDNLIEVITGDDETFENGQAGGAGKNIQPEQGATLTQKDLDKKPVEEKKKCCRS